MKLIGKMVFIEKILVIKVIDTMRIIGLDLTKEKKFLPKDKKTKTS